MKSSLALEESGLEGEDEMSLSAMLGKVVVAFIGTKNIKEEVKNKPALSESPQIANKISACIEKGMKMKVSELASPARIEKLKDQEDNAEVYATGMVVSSSKV